MSAAPRRILRFPLRIPTCPRASTSYTPLPTLQWPTPLTPCRAMSVYGIARSKHHLGQHKSLGLHRYEVPKPDAEHRIKLVTDGGELIEEISMGEVLDRIKPGYILCPHLLPHTNEMKNVTTMKERELHKRYNEYRLVEVTLDYKPKAFKHKGFLQCKTIPITGKRMSSPSLFSRELEKAYRMLEEKHPVEMFMRLPGRSGAPPKRSKREYSLYPEKDPVQYEEWEWVHAHLPFLRPDNILKSMPEGTQMWLVPYTNGANVYWVFGPRDAPFQNLPQRLENMKKKVRTSILEGKQSQLPTRFKEQLRDAGHKEYITESVLPETLYKGRLLEHQLQIKYGDSKDRYMVVDKKKESKRGRGPLNSQIGRSG